MKAVLVLIAAIAFAAAPFLSPEFGGFDADRYPIPQDDPPVQPAGWAFAIWGIIYLGLLAHAAFGLLKLRDDPAWERGRVALLVSLAVGAIWLPVALVSPLWATALIWVMLLSALAALYRMRAATPVWIAQWPVALYAGWLSAASFVSIGLFLGGYGVTTEITAAFIALGLATAFAAVNALALRLWPYGVAVVWGFAGIAAANSGTANTVAIGAAAATCLIAALTVWSVVRRA